MARRLIALTLGGLLAGSGVLVAGGAADAAAVAPAAAPAVLPAMVPALGSAVLPEGERVAGQWYMSEWFNFDKLAARGATGEGVKIAVIDTALNPDVPELAGANIKVMGSTCIDPGTGEPWEAVNTDPAVSAHGTNAVAMLVGNGVAGDGGAGARGIAPKAEIMFYGTSPIEPRGEDGLRSYWDACVLNDPTVKPGETSLVDESELRGPYGPSDVSDNSDGHWESEARTVIQLGDSTAIAARAAIRDGADLISMSVDSGNTIPWDGVLIEAQRAGVPVFVGTRNPSDQMFEGGLTKIYQVNGTVPVNAVEQDGSPLQAGAMLEAAGTRNLAVAAPGRDLLGVGVAEGWGPELIHGTSYATPLVAGTVALGMQMYPDASAFQVLQALIRTTNGGELHEPVREDDTTGYGFANPGGMLNVDPTRFADENPMYVTSLDDPRCTDPENPEEELSYRSNNYWNCYWSTGPTPRMEAEYWAAREGDTPESPGGVTEPAESDDALPVWMFVVGGLGLLVVVAAAVLVPVLVTRSRKPSAAQQQPAPQQYPGTF